MATTMTSTPDTRSKLRSEERPARTRKVPIDIKPSVEERAQLRRDRISAAVAVLIIIGMISLLVWAALAGGTSDTNAMWDVPYLY